MFIIFDLTPERQRVDRLHPGTHSPISHLPTGPGLTGTKYSLVLLPGLVAGHLSDLGYFKRTLFISRSVAGFICNSNISRALNQRDFSRCDVSHGRVQEVLATLAFPRLSDWSSRWDGLRSGRFHHVSVV